MRGSRGAVGGLPIAGTVPSTLRVKRSTATGSMTRLVSS